MAPTDDVQTREQKKSKNPKRHSSTMAKSFQTPIPTHQIPLNDSLIVSHGEGTGRKASETIKIAIGKVFSQNEPKSVYSRYVVFSEAYQLLLALISLIWIHGMYADLWLVMPNTCQRVCLRNLRISVAEMGARRGISLCYSLCRLSHPSGGFRWLGSTSTDAL